MQIGATPPSGQGKAFRTCRAKKQHHSKEKALEAREQMLEYASHAVHLEAYECSICGCWHLGHSYSPKGRLNRLPDTLSSMQEEMDKLNAA